MLELMIAARPALVPIMLIVFTGLILWAYAPRRRAHLDECARIPLRDGDRPDNEF